MLVKRPDITATKCNAALFVIETTVSYGNIFKTFLQFLYEAKGNVFIIWKEIDFSSLYSKARSVSGKRFQRKAYE